MALSVLEDVGMLFYVTSPNKTSFETVDEVPNYGQRCIPYFVFFMVCEQLYLLVSKKETGKINEMLHSMTHGAFEQAVNAVFHTWRLVIYMYIYENWRIVTLPWNSLWTWWICFFAVDFLYYFGHRACHEVNFLWAAHQVHHSSEHYNLATSFRQSAVQYYLQGIFYLPLALAIPPSAFLVHLYLNLVFQFWIHTETVKSIGPLEYVFNTASHHRVHHGRNRYCIDKNYAGVLIIWDRLFGTFQAEDEPVVYGLVENVKSFNLLHVQTHYYKKLLKTFLEMKGFRNKLYVLVKGPGWSPGKPRLGCPEDIPEIEYPVKKYEPKLEGLQLAYMLIHSGLLILILASFETLQKELSTVGFYFLIAFFILSLSSLSDFSEGKNCSNTELIRFMMFFALEFGYLNGSTTTLFTPWVLTAFRLVYLASVLLWSRSVSLKLTKLRFGKVLAKNSHLA